MTAKQLRELIACGENLNVEFKQKFSEYEKIAKEIIAFANTNGGFIIFGINDNGKIFGVDSEKEIAELVEYSNKNYCQPKIIYSLHYIEIDNKEIVVVEVPESKNKPHRIEDYKSKLDLNTSLVYIRVNDKSVPASKEMIKILQTQALEKNLTHYSIGKNEKLVFEFLNENDFITVKSLSKLANLSNRRASRTLINLVRAGILAIHTKDNGESYYSIVN